MIVGLRRGLGLEEQKERAASFDDDFELMRAAFIRGLRQDSLVKLIYTYGPVTDDELEEYLLFLDTEAGGTFHIYLNSARTVLFKYAGKKLAENIAALLT
jgi:hypothetical protein